MLVLGRREGETVKVGESIEVTVVEIDGKYVRLGFSAPKEVGIVRSELCTGEIPGVHFNGDVPGSDCV